MSRPGPLPASSSSSSSPPHPPRAPASDGAPGPPSRRRPLASAMATKPPAGARPEALLLRPRRAKPARGRLEVALRTRPRAYAPGSGPPLQRVRLLPPDDSTAFIVDRILLPSPGPAADGRPLPRRMTYVVGWRDLPAARRLVPAMDVLDYVSPRALEDWELHMELQLYDDRRAPPDAAPNKARPPAHTAIESAAAAEPAAATPTRIKAGAMSLSMPHKARLEDFEGLYDDDDDYDDDESATPLVLHAPDAGWHSADDDAHDDANAGARPAPPPSRGPTTPSRLALHPGLPPESAQTRAGHPGLPDWPFHAEPLARAVGGFTPFNGLSSAPATANGTKRSAAPARRETPPAKRPKQPRGKTKPGSASKPAPAARTAVDDDGAEAWVVKRLEDVALYDVEGRGLVRYFQVRWEGDWPPDQNPTWEPEENIPPNMVRNFFKQGRRRKRAAPARKRAPRAAEASLGAGFGYRSVGEAFAGEAADDGESELFVIDEDQTRLAESARAGYGLHASALGFV